MSTYTVISVFFLLVLIGVPERMGLSTKDKIKDIVLSTLGGIFWPVLIIWVIVS